MTKLPTVEETKIQVAAEYGCENYEHDYEFGLGISKLMDPFEFMERVCESHTAAHTAGLEAKYKEAYSSAAKYAEESVRLRKRVKELEERYNRLNANYVDMVAENTSYRQALESIAARWNKVAEHNEMRTALHLIQQDVFEALKQ